MDNRGWETFNIGDALSQLMSRGPGHVTKALFQLFGGQQRVLFTTTDLCRIVYGCEQPTKAQRVAVLRAVRKISATGQISIVRWVLKYEKADDVFYSCDQFSNLPAGHRAAHE